ncbi:hypothetical protein N7454_003583 [Penicillium verhagenii]|nr:hypothetical protein N7454_003583 [Penicillium verhagenii]
MDHNWDSSAHKVFYMAQGREEDGERQTAENPRPSRGPGVEPQTMQTSSKRHVGPNVLKINTNSSAASPAAPVHTYPEFFMLQHHSLKMK